MSDIEENLAYQKAKMIIDLLPEPLNFIATDLHDYDVNAYLHDPDRRDTVGAEHVRKTGFTTNHYRWLMQLGKKMILDPKDVEG